MRPVTDDFLSILRGSHRMIGRARVVTGLPTGTDPDGTEVPIESGDVQFDATADVRATLDMTTIYSWPGRPDGLLAPYGNEIFIERGIVVSNDLHQWVSLGYYRIETPQQDNAPRGPIRISAKDRMAGIIEARLIAPRQYLTGTTLGDIVADLVLDVYPAAIIEWDDDTDADTITRAQTTGDDRYKFLHDLVTARGKVMWFDYRGVLRIATPPDIKSPVWTVDAGENGVLVTASRQLSREGIYNAVVATGQAADDKPPVRAVARDNNPSSPTFWGGKFGKVPRFYSSSFMTTTGQCAGAAYSILSRSLGLPYKVDFSSVPNMALEVLDPVGIYYGPGTSTETHVMQQITMPLTAKQAMTGSTRELTNAVIGTTGEDGLS